MFILFKESFEFIRSQHFPSIAARRLTEAEEFEADSDVLTSGYDRAEYMQTIFKQLFGYSPEIANGLRNSLTKKRFKMMTTQTKSRHSLAVFQRPAGFSDQTYGTSHRTERY